MCSSDLEIEIVRVRFYDGNGKETHSFKTGEYFSVQISYHSRQKLKKPVFGIAIHKSDGTHINGPNTKFAESVPEYIRGRGSVWYQVESLPLLPGTYYLSAVVYNYACDHPFDHHERMYPFLVTPGKVTEEEYGAVWIPSAWKYEGEHGKIVA